MNSTATVTRDPRPATPWEFRRARLSPVRWAAILAPGYLAGVATAVATGNGKPSLPRVLAFAVGGALTGVLLARAVDELRWRRQPVSLEVQEPDAALDLMQAVRAEGVRADMVRADHLRAGPAYAVRYRAKDDRRVRAMLAEQQR